VWICWIGLATLLWMTYFFANAALNHVRVGHGEIVTFELFLFVLFVITIFVDLRERYLRGLGRGSSALLGR
jgi:hypothetical protein